MPLDPKEQMQIMLIDNDKHIREALSVFFGADQMRFLIFKSAAEGLNALKYQKIDVVISDYFLPDMDGVIFLKKVREKSPKTARVLMATITSDDLKQDIKDEGIDCFLEKPLTIAGLDSVLIGLNEQFETNFNGEKKNG